MSRSICATLVVVAGLGLAPTAAQQPETIDGYLAAAKQAAGFDFTGALVRLCVAPQTAPGRDVAPPPPPPRTVWYTDPGRVFDNLYFVGSRIHSSWALTSSEGIILIDTLFDYNSEEAIVDGLRKLGLDPAAVKYVIISQSRVISR